MGQTRAERTWPKQRTRHCWVRGLDRRHPLAPPSPGIVIQWRRTKSGSYEGWVSAVVDLAGGEVSIFQGWVPAHQIKPVPSDPNRIWGLR